MCRPRDERVIMSYKIIGTCSECGGPVGIPLAWLGIFPPAPECLHCHATKKDSYGPVIDMEPAKKYYYRGEFDFECLWDNLKPPTAEEIRRWRREEDDKRSY